MIASSPPLTIKEAAAALRISLSLTYQLCKRGKIRCMRHGLGRGTIRIPADAIQEYRQRCTVDAEAESAPPEETPAEPPSPREKGKKLELW